MFELLVTMGLIVTLAAMAIPVLGGSTERNRVWTASETIGTQIRQARFKAISRNLSFRVQFDCPAAGQFRVLELTGDTSIDNAANRCATTRTYDSGIYQMPAGVSYGTPAALTVSSRGGFTSTGPIPSTITVSAGGSSRSMNVSATGQIAFSVY